MYTKKQIIANFIWKLLEGIGDQFINFVITIILARILSPDDYGLIALSSVFMNLASKLVMGGINTALIQKKEIDDLDISTAFIITVSSSFLIFLLLFLSSDMIAAFYNNEEFAWVIKVLSFQVFIMAFTSIQYALIIKKMKFQLWCLSNWVSGILSGILSIFMAVKGLGVWSLVTYQITKSLLTQVIVWFTLKWRPQLNFSIKRGLALWKFGYKVLLGSLLELLNDSIYEAIIGKKNTKAELGYYSKGKQFPTIFMSVTNNAVSTILLPVLSSEQDNKDRINDMLMKTIVTSSFVLFPALIGLLLISPNLIIVLLTEKWLLSVPILQLECLFYLAAIIQQPNFKVFCAIGRSDLCLLFEFIRFIATIIVIIITLPYGIIMMELSRVLVAMTTTFISLLYVRHLLGFHILKLFINMIPILGATAIMSLGIFPLSFLQLPSITILCMQIAGGIIIYGGICWIFNINSMKELVKRSLLSLRAKGKSTEGKRKDMDR